MRRDTPRALITGISGQDGSYLAELLLSKGYEVHGIIRRTSSVIQSRIEHLYQDPHTHGARLFRHYGDLSDGSNLNRLLTQIQPHEIYHLGAQSHVRVSFEIPEYTADVTGVGTLRLLEAIRDVNIPTKFYNAASSEMFGNAPALPITERSAFRPSSPYACAKLFSYWTTVNYRESYGLFAANGILFNHESPRRGETFVTRKIVRGLSKCASGHDDILYLGNLDAKRDWGYAPEYVEGMWRMLQAPTPGDYILATGEMHSVREFVAEVCIFFGFDLVWQGKGVDEVGKDRKSNRTLIRIDPRYFRPTEVHDLLGDATKAKQELGWSPTVKFKELVRIMATAEKDAFPRTHS